MKSISAFPPRTVVTRTLTLRPRPTLMNIQTWVRSLAHGPLRVPARVQLQWFSRAFYGYNTGDRVRNRWYHATRTGRDKPVNLRLQCTRPIFPTTLSFKSQHFQRTHTTSMTSVVPSSSPDEYRLPLDVKPTHYDVTVRTDLEKLAFDGFVKIRCVALGLPLVGRD